jgi:hypothetical protein
MDAHSWPVQIDLSREIYPDGSRSPMVVMIIEHGAEIERGMDDPCVEI